MVRKYCEHCMACSRSVLYFMIICFQQNFPRSTLLLVFQCMSACIPGARGQGLMNDEALPGFNIVPRFYLKCLPFG